MPSSKPPLSLQDFLQESRERVNVSLQKSLSQQTSPFIHTDENRVQRFCDAAQYSISNGGKRLRPALVFATAKALDFESDDLALLAASIECLHSYSLVHDDLPAMDDDDLRRGKPTCHIAYDEATAILVGDGLQAFAFELVCQCKSLSAVQQVKIIQLLAQAAGNMGMVGGQAIDLSCENTQPNVAQLESMHSLKTGAIIRCAVAMAAIAANTSAVHTQALDAYAAYMGLAFQVQDDILDIESDTKTLGKAQGADVMQNKATYPGLLGMDVAKQKAATLTADAKAAIAGLPADATLLNALADFIIEREF